MLDQIVRVLRLAGMLAVPLLAGAVVVATIAGPLRPVRGTSSYAQLSPALAMADVAAGVALVGAGVAAWLFRRRLVGLLAMLAGLCWFGADWAAGLAVDPVLRATAMAATMLVLPLLIGLVVASERVRPGRGATVILVGLGVLTMILTAAWMARYWPQQDARCLELCGMPPIGPDPDRNEARTIRSVLLVIQVLAGLALASWSLRRLARASSAARWADGPILVAAVGVGLAWAAWAVASAQPSTVTPPLDTLMVSLFLARALALAALAAGLARVVARAWRTTREVRELTWKLTPQPGSGSLRVALATAMGDPGLQLRFPLPDTGRLVDPDGQVVMDVGPGTRVPIEHAGEVVAVAITTVSSGNEVGADLGDAVRLAAANERLLAAVRHEVVELRASRARIVQTGDDERHRLERDLHDGAQQRMLAVLHGLVVARDAARDAGDPIIGHRLDRAVDEVDAAIDALRRIARGIHPTLLTEAGLVAALEQLAIEAPLPVETDLPEAVTCGPMTAAIAWRVVADAVVQADRLAAEELRLRVQVDDARVRLTITIDGTGGPLDLVPLEDRVGAGGGSLVPVATQTGTHSFIVELPCV